MEYGARLFSLAFFAAFAVNMFFGSYAFYRNPRARLNRVFLALCISLCFWTLGLSMANSAADLETCLLWRRVAAVGWGSIYAFLLHFLLLLRAENSSGRPQMSHWLLYLPAVIIVTVFAFSGDITAAQYNLVRTELGWIDTGVHNVWTIFFNIYYISYGLASLAVLWHWRKRSEDPAIRQQALIILSALVAALLLGTATDTTLSLRLGSQLPPLAPIFTLIPIAAVYYCMKSYSLMPEIREEKGDHIFTSINRTRMYYYLATGFMAGGLLNFMTNFFDYLVPSQEGLSARIFASVLMVFLGVLVLFFQLIKDEKIKTPLMLAVMLLSIPLITFQYIWFSAITVWVIPILLMMVSLTFNSRIPLLLITGVAIITQLVLWQRIPEGALKIDEFDFFIRIGIFLIAFWIGSFINKTYVERYKENIYQSEFQKMVSEISFAFVSVNQSNIKEKIDDMLGKIGHFFGADHTYVAIFDHQKKALAYAYEWHAEGIEKTTELQQIAPLEVLPWWMEQLKNCKLVTIEDINDLPREASTEKDLLLERGVQSTAAIPVEGSDIMLGFVGLESVVSPRKWSSYHIELLRIIANLLADGLIKSRAQEEIEFMAYYDHLTRLPNRVLFSDRLGQAIHLAERNGNFVGIIFIDLDSFKMVNDTMGHSAGDIMLKTVALALENRLRKTDTVARFGGDEFLVLVNNLRKDIDIVTVADNIMKIFERPFVVKGQEFNITCSAGVAVYPFDGEDAGTLIKNADIAMYTAKSKGKNQYQLCTFEMKEGVRKNILLSNNLYRVQERNELAVHYQPQISLSTNQIVGLEALLRWKHPEMGMIPPNVFIPLAEMNGTINGIGEWVLKTTISQNKKWQDKGYPFLRVAVNLSVIQLNNPFFVERLDQMLKETGLDPRYLELEITESIATREADHIIDTLNRLKKLGVTISIDDFGTEYSSLNRLKVLPIDRIKIDMQFVQGIENSEKDRAITKVVINLAQSLGLKVLAEGVETESQLNFLNQRMCDEVQGYYYYKPMPGEEIEKLFEEFFPRGDLGARKTGDLETDHLSAAQAEP